MKPLTPKLKRTIYCYATTPPVLYSGEAIFLERLTQMVDLQLGVPSAVVNTYKSATTWSSYAALISAI